MSGSTPRHGRGAVARRRGGGGLTGGLVLLGTLALAALLAEPLSPHPPGEQHRDQAFHPPMLTRVRMRAPDGGGLRWPFVCAVTTTNAALKEYAEDCSELHPLRLLAPGAPYRLLGLLPAERRVVSVAPPGVFFPLGSDRFGRDLLARTLHGARVSLTVAVLGAALALGVGVLVGGVAGYLGGVPDFLIMRGVELVSALPGLYVLLVLREAVGARLRGASLYLVVVIVLGLLAWGPHARVVRGMVLSLRRLEYVLAARAQGFSEPVILLRHVLPAVWPYVLVAAALAVPAFVLGEVALSFLGLGVQEPQASWGLLLRDAQSLRSLRDFPWVLVPGGFLFLTVLGANLLGEGLRDRLGLDDERGQRT